MSFLPPREIVVAAMAPEQFPTVRAERTTATFQFEPAGGSTSVRLTQTGWKSGKEWDQAYEYLAARQRSVAKRASAAICRGTDRLGQGMGSGVFQKIEEHREYAGTERLGDRNGRCGGLPTVAI